jgi:hypothetical protein
MVNILEVVEELAATAYERGTKRISVSQIERELNNVEQWSAQNVEEVCKTLADLGYQVRRRTFSPPYQSSVSLTDL